MLEATELATLIRRTNPLKRISKKILLIVKRVAVKIKRFFSRNFQITAKVLVPFGLKVYIDFMNLRNRILRKPRIFIYTDSRGQFVTHQYLYRRGIFPFYAIPLLKDFFIEYHTCPEKHTTIIDFLKTYESSSKRFDYVIAHVGIVDFSPRHQTTAIEVYQLKKHWYDKVFNADEMEAHLGSDLGVKYEGDKTINMFSLDMVKNSLIPYFNIIPNLIYIGCNPFVPGWEGNYWRDRPKNIRLVEDYSAMFCAELEFCVDISDWTNDEIQRFTVDNIHFTPEGGKEILKRLRNVIVQIESLEN